MSFLAIIAFLLMGVILGVLGGGGSILTVPICVYLLHYDAVEAIGYGYFIVCVTSFIGVVQYLKLNLIQFRTASYFGLSTLIAIYLTKAFLLPIIPDHIVFFQKIHVNKSSLLLVLLGIIICISAWSMIKKTKFEKWAISKDRKVIYYLLSGSFVGILTGLLGVGGGFLIVPSLVLFFGLSMKQSVATSMLIICLNTAFGFLLHWNERPQFQWEQLMVATSLSIVGVITGIQCSKKMDGEKLKPAFAVLLFCIAILIFYNEIHIK